MKNNNDDDDGFWETQLITGVGYVNGGENVKEEKTSRENFSD